MADSVIIIEVLGKIYNLLVKMEERLDNIETHLKKYEPKEGGYPDPGAPGSEKKQLLNG